MSFASARLFYGPHRPENLARLHAWANDPEIQELSADDVTSEPLEATALRLAHWTANEDPSVLHVALYRDDVAIGFAHLAGIDPVHRRCRLGLVIGEKALWGQGYGTEAVIRLCRFAFEALHLDRVAADVYATNPASARMLEKAGFVREGTLRRAVRKGGVAVDQHVYGLVRWDWPTATGPSAP